MFSDWILNNPDFFWVIHYRGLEIMKKNKHVIINLGILLLFICFVVIVFPYLKGNKSIPMIKNKMENKGVIDEKAKEFADKAFVPAELVSVDGLNAKSGSYIYNLENWSISKEFPDLEPLPDKEEMMTYQNTQIDDSGMITDEHSYVIIEMNAENESDHNGTELFWPHIRLKIVGVGSDDFIGIASYVGEYGKESNQNLMSSKTDQLKIGENKTKIIIYVVPDDLLEQAESEGLYLELNPTGSVITDPDKDPRCFIPLNYS